MAEVAQHVYRACKSSAWGRKKASDAEKAAAFTADAGEKSLYPDYDGFQRKDGSFRAPDVTSYQDQQGVTWVQGATVRVGASLPYRNEGVSLSTEAGKFGYAMWFYFLLPKGTEIPASLDIVQTGKDKTHYSLRCVNPMRKDAYEGALNTLAREAIAKAVEIGRQSLYFSL